MLPGLPLLFLFIVNHQKLTGIQKILVKGFGMRLFLAVIGMVGGIRNVSDHCIHQQALTSYMYASVRVRNNFMERYLRFSWDSNTRAFETS